LKGKTRCKKQCKTIKDRLMMQRTKGDRRQKWMVKDKEERLSLEEVKNQEDSK
jgi:hypothetical protein